MAGVGDIVAVFDDVDVVCLGIVIASFGVAAAACFGVVVFVCFNWFLRCCSWR